MSPVFIHFCLWSQTRTILSYNQTSKSWRFENAMNLFCVQDLRTYFSILFLVSHTWFWFFWGKYVQAFYDLGKKPFIYMLEKPTQPPIQTCNLWCFHGINKTLQVYNYIFLKTPASNKNKSFFWCEDRKTRFLFDLFEINKSLILLNMFVNWRLTHTTLLIINFKCVLMLCIFAMQAFLYEFHHSVFFSKFEYMADFLNGPS